VQGADVDINDRAVNKLFTSQYPIIEAVMNLASTPNLAAAVDEAGAFPSLWIPPNDADQAYSVVKEFYKLTGHANVLISIPLSELRNQQLISIIKQFKISHVEVWGLVNNQAQFLNFDQVYDNYTATEDLKNLRSISKILLRIVDPVTSPGINLFDGVCIKGQESAGLSGSWKVKDLFIEQKKINPELQLVPYGGVGSPDQVAEYLKLGAPAVAVGTLFAVSKESPLSNETKEKMIQSTKDNLVKNIKTGQNLLCLADTIKDDLHDWNCTGQLRQGMHGNGTQGFVYAGHGIDHVTSLRTVKQTVEFLMSKLENDLA
jgi:enoyl-[acyl-carrier protein] reductase II